MHLSWRWGPLTKLGTNLLEVMFLQWCKKWRRVPTCTTDEDDGDKVVHCNISGMPSLWLPFFLQSVELTDVPLSDFLPPWWLSVLVSKWGFFAKEALPDSGTGCFCTLNLNPAFGLALSPFLKVKDWNKSGEDYCWVWVRDQLIQP